MNVPLSVSVPPEMVEQIDAEREDNETRSEAIRRMLRSEDHIGYQLEQAQDTRR
ncbi:ribbon-helix-helix domain-containing protein [Halorubrum ezzemoulense]|uniref:ribbon-helix-helix domain-containing protein n=1 Tax=Halorubrum ezzemoulense TaxID=337243 RepID=UPI00232BEEAD|nr:ribbon-helix-helix domain-containing protein [Halorubrum ezzemoulense]MDB2265996.1 ribbon-helix-helix domain-containing protein [Halorubrum ezzemoulense]